jgi:hypothetical protein
MPINKIDAVILWVDGNDPNHKQKINSYRTNKEKKNIVLAGDTRFNSVGEIKFCVAGILRNATFVKRIFIVTDNQNPNLDEFIEKNFPENKVPIVIIDHKEIFRENLQYLPVFNSLSIESCIHNIKDLSEEFLYFNDDFIILRPTSKENFFSNGKMIANGKWKKSLNFKILRFINKLIFLPNPVMDNYSLRTANLINIKNKFLQIRHVPHPQKISVREKLYNEFPDILKDNLSYKFRSTKQHNPQCATYMYAENLNELIVKREANYIYLYPARKNNQQKYIDSRLEYFNNNKNVLFGCFQSLDQTNEEQREYIISWLKGILNIEI